MPPDAAEQFAAMWHNLAGDLARLYQLVREYEFHDSRGWRFDAAWPDLRVAVEIQGGGWKRGRHHRGRGYQNDCLKRNAATLAGWAVLTYTTDDLDKRPVQVVEEVAAALQSRE